MSSCNSPILLPSSIWFSSRRFPGCEGRPRTLSLTYSDPVLHVVLSHQHFVVPFPLRMYYILVSSFSDPSPSVTDSGLPTWQQSPFCVNVLSRRCTCGSNPLRQICRDLSSYQVLVPDTTLFLCLPLFPFPANYSTAPLRYSFVHRNFFRDLQRRIHIYPNPDNENTTVRHHLILLPCIQHPRVSYERRPPIVSRRATSPLPRTSDPSVGWHTKINVIYFLRGKLYGTLHSKGLPPREPLPRPTHNL